MMITKQNVAIYFVFSVAMAVLALKGGRHAIRTRVAETKFGVWTGKVAIVIGIIELIFAALFLMGAIWMAISV